MAFEYILILQFGFCQMFEVYGIPPGCCSKKYRQLIFENIRSVFPPFVLLVMFYASIH